MSVIKSAESHILSTQKSKAYIGLAGDANYNKNIQKLILGDIKIASPYRPLEAQPHFEWLPNC